MPSLLKRGWTQKLKIGMTQGKYCRSLHGRAKAFPTMLFLQQLASNRYGGSVKVVRCAPGRCKKELHWLWTGKAWLEAVDGMSKCLSLAS